MSDFTFFRLRDSIFFGNRTVPPTALGVKIIKFFNYLQLSFLVIHPHLGLLVFFLL